MTCLFTSRLFFLFLPLLSYDALLLPNFGDMFLSCVHFEHGNGCTQSFVLVLAGDLQEADLRCTENTSVPRRRPPTCVRSRPLYMYIYIIYAIYVSKMSILFDSHRCHPLSSVSDRKRHLTSSPSMNSGNLEICWGWSRWLNYCKTATTTTTTTTSYAHQTSQTHHKHITNTSQTHHKRTDLQ